MTYLRTVKRKVESHTLAAATTSDTTITIPADSTLVAVTFRVTTTITGPASWKAGKATDSPADRFGSSLALTSGTTHVGLDGVGPMYNTVAVAVRFAAQDDATSFSGGVVEVWIDYLPASAPPA